MDLARSRRRLPFGAIIFTVMMVALLSFATHPIAHELSFIMVAAIFVAVGVCSRVLPGSMFFTLALANLIAVYACFFVIILDSHFRSIGREWHWVGFMLPLVAFFASVLLRRLTIRQIVRSETKANPADYAHALLMLLPMVFIAVGAMIFAAQRHNVDSLRYVFMGAMGATSLIVFMASKDVVVFLLITGLLFESFFRRMAEMMAPVFAFFTFYSFVVLLFAGIYAGVDALTGIPHFRIMGGEELITFPEALYYSIVTLATVGYGDIVPERNLARLLSSMEVLTGVLLLLFGFHEIVSHSRELIRDRNSKT